MFNIIVSCFTQDPSYKILEFCLKNKAGTWSGPGPWTMIPFGPQFFPWTMVQGPLARKKIQGTMARGPWSQENFEGPWPEGHGPRKILWDQEPRTMVLKKNSEDHFTKKK